MNPIPDTGSIELGDFSNILLDLYRHRYTGRLVLDTETTRRSVLFDGGQPFYVESNLPQEQILAALVTEDKIRVQDQERVAELVAKSGCSEEKALLALRLLEPKALLQILREQTRRRLCHCFSEGPANYQLQPHPTAAGDAPKLPLDPLPILKEGMCQPDYGSRLQRDLEALPETFMRANRQLDGLLTRLAATQEERTVLTGLRGERSISEIIRELPAQPSRAILWILLQLDGFRIQTQRTTSPCSFEHAEIEIVVAENATGARNTNRHAVRNAQPQPSKARVADTALRDEILERHESLSEFSYYELLSVDTTAKAAEVKRAYFKLAKRYHPDALTRAGLEDLKMQANEVFSEIAKAYSILSDPTKRAEYEQLQAGGDESKAANRLMEAENLFRKAEILLRMGNFKGAEKLLTAVVKLWPEDASYQAALGWAVYRGSDKAALAKTHLEKAISLEPDHAQAHTYLSSVLRKLGNPEAAAQAEARGKALAASKRQSS